MNKSLRWYQIVRIILPVLYGAALAAGIIGKSFAVVIGLMVLALMTGAWYCGWLCPFGFVQEWLGRLGRLLKLPRLSVPEKAEKWLRFTRYILLALTLTGFGLVLFLTSPYGTFMGGLTGNIAYITGGAWIFFGVFILTSLLVDRPFCRYFCTEGARYGALSMVRLFSIRRNREKCISCGACDRICPVQINVSKVKHVRNGQCINCLQCIDACPVEGTLTYGWAFRKQGVTDEQK